jgi:pyruvate formate lyase activating enzyme
MQIRNFLRESFIDYPGRISSIVFAPGCNYKCPACHAKHLLQDEANIDENKFFEYLDSRKDWIDGVVICGGEPTLQPDLIGFLYKLKEKELSIKLDTNGSRPRILRYVLERGLVDYVAMDVKGPKELYGQITNSDINFDRIKESIFLVSKFPDYEFRTTVVPVKRNESTIFMTPEEIGNTAKFIYNCTGNKEHKYFLQPFVPRKGELIDSRFEEFPETSKELLEKGKIEARKYLSNTEIRT